ncbi:MAG TPA: PQQ-dependent dehydrogenase, methanol/ethanol family [Bryobacteraceae bacterium]|jgi:alcohol dehydrogenase (cytochrome c)
MMSMQARFLPFLIAASLPAQVSYDRLLHAAEEPHNWLTYSGSYMSQRYSPLGRITPQNVKTLEQKWVYQVESLQKLETSPLAVDGVLYITQPPNDVIAIDGRTGRAFWIYQYRPAPEAKPCCGFVNRGLAILNNTLFMATIDAHLVAIDATSGTLLWNTKVADHALGYAMTLAPLVVKDKVVVGVAGGEYGIRGFIAAYDASSGKEAWRFYTIPGPGEPGHDTWPAGDSWQHGGASIWVTGSFDPELNLTYWGIGNPGPDWNPAQRTGANLYSDSAVALDADTGSLKWHFQFSPNDPYDYDSVQVPVLVDAPWNGAVRKLMLWANRNGFFYALDRTNGKFLSGHPFVKVNWASGLDDSGKPIPTPQPAGAATYPGVQGGTNWYSPSYSPRTGLFYVSAWEDYASVFVPEQVEYSPGQRFTGGRPVSPIPGSPNPGLRGAPINRATEAAGHGAVLALDIVTGRRKWQFEMTDVTDSGILTTASDLLFTGGREGYFQALDARTGALLWKANVGGPVSAAPITYEIDGKQYVAIAGGHALFVYGLRE